MTRPLKLGLLQMLMLKPSLLLNQRLLFITCHPAAVAKLPDAEQVKGCSRVWAACTNLAAKGFYCCVTLLLQARLLALLRPQGLHIGPS